MLGFNLALMSTLVVTLGSEWKLKMMGRNTFWIISFGKGVDFRFQEKNQGSTLKQQFLGVVDLGCFGVCSWRKRPNA